jgi:hypothetical protein
LVISNPFRPLSLDPAIKTPATVRKLVLPVLQVNIARRQVNVAGATTGPA